MATGSPEKIIENINQTSPPILTLEAVQILEIKNERATSVSLDLESDDINARDGFCSRFDERTNSMN